MLFNSLLFIFLYLPIVLIGFAVLASRSHRLAVGWLVLASVVFYGWWNPKLVILLTASVLANFIAYRFLLAYRNQAHNRAMRLTLYAAVAGNLAVLAYFKYANFFLSTIAYVSGRGFEFLDIVLPLGISFFTFTQIAFLVDTSRGRAEEYDFLRYFLFVSYFPHLIAGPILHHREVMPQFARIGPRMRLSPTAAAVACTCFVIGLIKKVGIADSVAPVADLFFSAVERGAHLSMSEAWTGALAYTFQLYFDFSGYCDMAIGLSLLFGVRLPVNFNSPYKAASVIDFWRRWHMTLSRFLRDYLYFALGGNRRGPVRRYVNLIITMLLGGLWHGAGWTFVLWGGIHGLYLVVNHLWRASGMRLGAGPGCFLTFMCVVIAWVFFRADSLQTALTMLQPMLGFDGYSLTQKLQFPNELVTGRLSVFIPGLAFFALVWLFPNTQEIVGRYGAVIERFTARAPLGLSAWRPGLATGLATGIAFACGIALIGGYSPFLYFQF